MGDGFGDLPRDRGLNLVRLDMTPYGCGEAWADNPDSRSSSSAESLKPTATLTTCPGYAGECARDV